MGESVRGRCDYRVMESKNLSVKGPSLHLGRELYADQSIYQSVCADLSLCTIVVYKNRHENFQ